jgi:hypothetical protein
MLHVQHQKIKPLLQRPPSSIDFYAFRSLSLLRLMVKAGYFACSARIRCKSVDEPCSTIYVGLSLSGTGVFLIFLCFCFLTKSCQAVMWSYQNEKRISYHPGSVKKENDARK